ncbi:MAG: iron-containing alcohol dehydrogenase [Actinobacteria bacterium]|jgi:alcohol dehydrogenase class IV|nr:MAG: iron-containing alcohol dehydrogenase [Actinomycetota bacterium]
MSLAANTYRFPVQVIFGEGCLEETGAFVGNFGKHALLVTGSGPTSKCAAVEVLQGILTGEGITVSHFAGIEADPSVETVEKGVAFAGENGCDFVIALGGGSPLDAAKVIAARLNNEGDIVSWEGLGRIPRRSKPLICIPTTSGTGSEVTWVAVITGGKRRQKMSIVSQNLYPVLAIIDPELTYSMPPELTAATGMDALTHAVESCVARRAWEPTRSLSLKAAQLAYTNLEKACADGSDGEARHNMSMASFLAGMAFTSAGLGLAHALAHALGSHSGLAHGKANAILLPHVMRFNIAACPELYRELAVAMGLNVSGLPAPRAAEEAARAVQELVAVLPIPSHLEEAGIAETSLETLAAEAFLNTRLRSTNPRDTVLEDLVQVLRNASGG